MKLAIAARQAGWSSGLRPRHYRVGLRRRAAIGSGSALAMAWLAGTAFADSIPPVAPGSAASLSDQSAQTPAGAGTAAADLSSLLNPVPSALQQLVGQPFRADASTPPSTALAPGPLGLSWQGPNLLGDMWGLRPALSKYGVTLSILENAETFGNLSGGVKQGFETNGLTTVTLQMDTEKAFGLNGGLINVSGLQIWGGELSESNLLNLQTVTGIEDPSAFDFGNCGISRNSATSWTSRSVSRASTRNSLSAKARATLLIRFGVDRCFPRRICSSAPSSRSRA